MARGNGYNTAGTQFFICTGRASNLDGTFAAFGKVISGLDIIMQINEVEHDDSISAGGGVPIEDIVIKSMSVNTKGIDYPEPNKISK